MDKIPTMTIPEALNIIRPHIYGDPTNSKVLNAFNTIEDALLQNHERQWKTCFYNDGELWAEDEWDGKWYEWLDRYNNREIARMKADTIDHFFPPTRVIKEENVIAFREIERS